MAGIYVHIPFCRSKCAYCNFFSVPDMTKKESFLCALEREIEQRKDYLLEPINTIYFGGGTPSLLAVEDIGRIIAMIARRFTLNDDMEITIECNPDTLSLEYLRGIYDVGVNRLSIGIQSFFDDDLEYLNRRHDSYRALQCLDWIVDAGFSNYTIDLIYGIPTLTDEKWMRNLDIFMQYHIPHLSAYALTVEPKTILDVMIAKGKKNPVDEEQCARQFMMLMHRMKDNGYEHYEISNFAKPGCYSRHNTSYWCDVTYLGLGPSAHSFDGVSRQWNVSSLASYLNGMKEGLTVFEREHLRTDDRYNEYVMTSLRTMWGCDLNYVRSRFGDTYYSYSLHTAEKLIKRGLMKIDAEHLILTDDGKLLADGVAVEFFI